MLNKGLIALGVGLVVAACGGSSDTSLSRSSSGGDDVDGGATGSSSGGDNGATNDGTSSGTNSGTNGGTTTDGGNSGDTTGDTNGMVGTIGGINDPGPVVVDACEAFCDAKAEADCPNDDDPAECQVGCQLLAGSSRCAEQFSALLECSEDATFACDDNGEAQPQGCALEAVRAAGCLVTPDPVLDEPCTNYCDAVQEADCPNDDARPGCVIGCSLAGNLVPACAEMWTDFLDCSEDADFACNDQGEAYPPACAGRFLSFLGCVLDAGNP